MAPQTWSDIKSFTSWTTFISLSHDLKISVALAEWPPFSLEILACQIFLNSSAAIYKLWVVIEETFFLVEDLTLWAWYFKSSHAWPVISVVFHSGWGRYSILTPIGGPWSWRWNTSSKLSFIVSELGMSDGSEFSGFTIPLGVEATDPLFSLGHLEMNLVDSTPHCRSISDSLLVEIHWIPSMSLWIHLHPFPLCSDLAFVGHTLHSLFQCLPFLWLW